jgi:hypothetical protein
MVAPSYSMAIGPQNQSRKTFIFLPANIGSKYDTAPPLLLNLAVVKD